MINKKWKTSEFDYFLPPDLIAQQPTQKRDISKLLVVRRRSNDWEDKIFSDIIDYFDKDDVLGLDANFFFWRKCRNAFIIVFIPFIYR